MPCARDRTSGAAVARSTGMTDPLLWSEAPLARSRRWRIAAAMLLSVVTLAACKDDGGGERGDDVRSCGAKQALDTEGQCTGSATPCGSFSAIGCSPDGCTVDIGAYDDPYDDVCTGYPKDCDEFGHDYDCQD